MSEQPQKGRQGFASMSPEQRRDLASKGGKKATELGTAHRWSSESAKEAGRQGGLKSAETKRRRKAEAEAAAASNA